MSDVFNKDGSDPELPDEQQLDEYLRGESAVSQQYRQLRSADVPAELDRLVLRQASDAVKAPPAKSRAWTRWAAPLALAASAVLVVSIVIESGVHHEAYVAVPVSAPTETALRMELPRAKEAEEKATAGSAADASVVQVVPVQPEVMLDAAEPAAIAPAPAPASAPPEERALASERTERPAPAAPQFTPPPANAIMNESPARLSNREEADADARASSRMRSQEASSELEEAVVTGVRKSEAKRSAGPRNTVAVPAAADKQGESRDYADPEQWLRDIRELRKENKQEEADREWRRFRYVFPNYEVAGDDLARSPTR